MPIHKPTPKYLSGLNDAIRQRQEYRDSLDQLSALATSEHWKPLKARLQNMAKASEVAVWNSLYSADSRDPAIELADLRLRAGVRQATERIIMEVEQPGELIDQVSGEIVSMKEKAAQATAQLKELSEGLR